MPANQPTIGKTKKQRRNPILAQRDARAALAKNAPKGSGQAVPPAPPNIGTTPAPAPPKTPESVASGKAALETLPDAELISKAEILLPDYDSDWDRAKLIDELLKAGVTG